MQLHPGSRSTGHTTRTHMNGGREKGYPAFFSRKMLSIKLYIRNRTPLHAKTATFCVRESEMRGTLTVRAIAQNARRPSEDARLAHLTPLRAVESNLRRHTQGSNNLRLKAQLALEVRGEVCDSTAAISCDVRHLADVVEHMPAGKEQNCDQAEGCPDIAVLHNGDHIGRCRRQQCTSTKDNSDPRPPPHPVDGPFNLRMRSIWQVPSQPASDLFGSGWPEVD